MFSVSFQFFLAAPTQKFGSLAHARRNRNVRNVRSSAVEIGSRGSSKKSPSRESHQTRVGVQVVATRKPDNVVHGIRNEEDDPLANVQPATVRAHRRSSGSNQRRSRRRPIRRAAQSSRFPPRDAQIEDVDEPRSHNRVREFIARALRAVVRSGALLLRRLFRSARRRSLRDRRSRIARRRSGKSARAFASVELRFVRAAMSSARRRGHRADARAAS